MVARGARAGTRRLTGMMPVAGGCWDALRGELNRWPRSSLRFWWRDDDAAEDSEALRRLLALRAALALPLALSVIPAAARPSLSHRLDAPGGDGAVRALAHGWDHHDWSMPGEPKAELAPSRSAVEVNAQLADGRRRLTALLGPLLLPVLVPPFNQLSPHLVDSVRAAGFAYASIDRDFAPIAMPTRNVHVDVIDWARLTGAAPESCVRDILAALRLRRYRLVDRRAPIGIMTHHLVHDESAWTVTERLLQTLRDHPAVTFPAISEIFSP